MVVPPAESVVTLVSGVVPPTTPPKVVVPAVVTVSVFAPFTVDARLIAPVLELVNVVASPSVTASLYVCAPVVEIVFPLMAVVPVPSVVTLVSLVAPTAPPKVVVVAFTVRARVFEAESAFTVLARFTVVPASVTASAVSETLSL